VLYRALAHRPLLEANDRDNLRGDRELKILAYWGPESLVKAIGEVSRAMQDDRTDLAQRLFAMDLLAWMLQADPKMRPETCFTVISHPFFEGTSRARGGLGEVWGRARVRFRFRFQ